MSSRKEHVLALLGCIKRSRCHQFSDHIPRSWIQNVTSPSIAQLRSIGNGMPISSNKSFRLDSIHYRPCEHLTASHRQMDYSLPLLLQKRSFTTSPRRQILGKVSRQRAAARAKSGPFSALGAILFLIAGAGMVVYFRQEKARVERARIAEQSKGVGRPKVGGEFALVDQDGHEFTHHDLKGGFSLVYFGFTHCPDICPEELDKMANIIDLVNKKPSNSISTSSYQDPATSAGNSPNRAPLLPLFITCDPARDTPGVLKPYLKEFHPGLVGVTGTWEEIKDVCKKYRVYFSTPPSVKPGDDYLVDHSIYFYLMDPEGDFIEAIGRQHSAEKAAQIIREHMSDWSGTRKKT